MERKLYLVSSLENNSDRAFICLADKHMVLNILLAMATFLAISFSASIFTRSLSTSLSVAKRAQSELIITTFFLSVSAAAGLGLYKALGASCLATTVSFWAITG